MASAKRGAPAASVDDYLAALPEPARATIEELRATIRAAAPAATEKISYQVPTFVLGGSLVAYAAFKDHCSFFVMSPAVVDAHRDELAVYTTAKATIHLPIGAPIPKALVTKLVKARIAEKTARRGSR